MKKLFLIIPLLAIAAVSYATCYRVTGSIRTIKVYYDANKRVLYEEVQGTQYYNKTIEARDMEDAKRQAMRDCESMCYSSDNIQEIRENGKVTGYYRLMRRTEITDCHQSYDCN